VEQRHDAGRCQQIAANLLSTTGIFVSPILLRGGRPATASVSAHVIVLFTRRRLGGAVFGSCWATWLSHGADGRRHTVEVLVTLGSCSAVNASPRAIDISGPIGAVVAVS